MKRSRLLVTMIMILVFSLSVCAEVKNVIYLIGDGMGLSHATMATIMQGKKLEMANMDYTGLATTFAANTFVTDSAAAGTALATGHKTNNGMISMSPDYKELETVLEKARKIGKKTGVVTTTTVYHATPASFTAHVKNRNHSRDIFTQQINSPLNVIFGGGLKYYEKYKKDIEKNNFKVVMNKKDLVDVEGEKVMGLFTDGYMNYELDRNEDEPSIALMTRKALQLLNKNNNKGFFLMVEGGRIDHAAHANDPVGMVYDLFAFDKAIKEAIDFAKMNKDTLIVVTADHETGGLGLGRGDYKVNLDFLNGFKATPDFIVSKFAKDFSDVDEKLAYYAPNFKIDAKEKARLMEQKDCKRPSGYSLGGMATYVLTDVINKKAMIDWTTKNHSGSMVPVYAHGKYSEKFTGCYDNTDIPKKIAEAMGFELK